jgi:hypothetical protein
MPSFDDGNDVWKQVPRTMKLFDDAIDIISNNVIDITL